MINARTAVDGDGAHLFCFRLTFCIHPDIIKITSEYSWYTGAYPIVMGEKGSRVRIPHRNATVMSKSYKSGLSLRYCASTLGFRAARVFCDWVVPYVGYGLFFCKKNRTLPSHPRTPGYSQYGRGGERQIQTRDLYGAETAVLRRN